MNQPAKRPKQQRDQIARLWTLIKRYGFSLVHIEESDGIPTYAYTVGLSHRIGYEFLICGLPPQQAQQLCSSAIEQGGFDKDKPQPVAYSIATGLVIKVVDVDMFYSAAFCDLHSVEFPIAEGGKFVQLLWPDANGKHVGDEGMSELPAKVQNQSWLIDQRMKAMSNPKGEK